MKANFPLLIGITGIAALSFLSGAQEITKPLLKPANTKVNTLQTGKRLFSQMKGMPGMKTMPGMKAMPTQIKSMSGMSMPGFFGNWNSSREGSGTSWQTDSAPMFMKMLPTYGGFQFSVMGTIQAGYVKDGGLRGDQGLFSNSMIMLMGRKEMGGGILGLHFMTSLDPILDSRQGNPNLFEGSFNINGLDINDRKDPHNVFSEVAVSYAHPLSKDWSGFVYGGPAGEPALGGSMYLHRTSGLEIPEAPISHDWFDGTHISFGVATLGLVYQDKWKLEGSGFNNVEPGNTLYGIDKFQLNSASSRVTFNPSKNWSFSASYGYLHSDATEHRIALSAAYSRALSKTDFISATAYLGQNVISESPKSNAILGEVTYYHGVDSYFARFERVDEDSLLNIPAGTYIINKLLFGDVHNIVSKDHLDYGVGAYLGLYSFPSELNSYYGKNPVTFGVFVRIRPSMLEK